MTSPEISEILRALKDHEGRIANLESAKQRGKQELPTPSKDWYKPGSTIAKIIELIERGFFNTPKSLTSIIMDLKTKDYHLESSDLTLPLRKIVRKGLLVRTKNTADNSPSKHWLYAKG